MTSAMAAEYLLNSPHQTNVTFISRELRFLAGSNSRILSRSKRQSCPGGVGNFGFNSFNFMTFVLLTLNAVANVNNNVNNNNNNNNDVNYNTINQDSNNLVSNSENTNMVMAVILPVPGKRSLDMINR